MPARSGDRPRQIAWEWRILQQWRNINLLNILSIHQIVVMGILKPCNGLAICPGWALPLALWQLEYDQTPPFDPELGKQKKIDGWMHEWNTEKCTSQLQKVKVTSLLLLCLITGQKLFCCNARWEKRCLVFCINITETINTFLHLCRAITVLALLNGVQGYSGMKQTRVPQICVLRN